MSDKEKYDFSNDINNAKEKVKEFVLEKKQLNNKLKLYILSLQNIDLKIFSMLIDAREFYYEARYNYNMKLAKLKNQKIEYERLWKQLNKKASTFKEPELNSKISTSIDSAKLFILDLQDKINILDQKLEEPILDINEENEIIENLRKLERDKQEKINMVVELEQKQAKQLQISEYYKTQRRIETLESDLKEIYEKMIKLYNKRLMTHKKMFDLYRKTREFENIKQELENELNEDKGILSDCYQLFLKLMSQNKKAFIEELSNRPIRKVLPRKKKPRNIQAIIKKKKKFKKLEQKKLAIALDKKKSGKKLDFYELQLILKHSKNRGV